MINKFFLVENGIFFFLFICIELRIFSIIKFFYIYLFIREKKNLWFIE